MDTLFKHRLANPDTLANPADSIAMLDNVRAALDNAVAMAKLIHAASGVSNPEIDPQDAMQAAWALVYQIEDARAILDSWENDGGARW